MHGKYAKQNEEHTEYVYKIAFCKHIEQHVYISSTYHNNLSTEKKIIDKWQILLIQSLNKASL